MIEFNCKNFAVFIFFVDTILNYDKILKICHSF